jgi:hypothetical protein
LLANRSPPSKTESRIQAQIAAERLAYEACEIFMNETAPNDAMTAAEIQNVIYGKVVKVLSG